MKIQTMMKRNIQHILFTLLLLVAGMEAWGYTTTYHIINLGRLNDNGQMTTSRTEALKFTSESGTISLPDQYKSPLAKNWKFYAESDVTYNSTTKAYTFNGDPSLHEGLDVTADSHVYITYEIDEDAFNTINIHDGGVYRIKADDKYYLQQTVWNGDPNTSFTSNNSLPTTAAYCWRFNIVDPYQITIQTKSGNTVGSYGVLTDFYLCKGGNFGDIRLRKDIATAKNTGVWAFALLHGGTSGTYRIIVTDGATGNETGMDANGHAYINRGSGKSRYNQYSGSTYNKCDLTLTPLTYNYIYNIVDKDNHIAIKYTTTTPELVGRKLTSYTDIPAAIRSPYLRNETMTFYSFIGAYDAAKLTDEYVTDGTPFLSGANIYVRYTTDHLNDADKILHLQGNRILNVKVNGDYIYDDGGTLNHETTDANKKQLSHIWYIKGQDPYAVQIQNAASPNRYIEYNTGTGALTLTDSPTNYRFVLLEGSDEGDINLYEQMELVAATGTTDLYRIARTGDDFSISTSTATGTDDAQVRAYPETTALHYYLIDKAKKLIKGPIDFAASRLSLPDEWVSPLVSTYHYYTTSGLDGDTYNPSGEVTQLSQVSEGDNIYVTYDVSDAIDITGGTTYMMRFDGEYFNQENGSDGVMTTTRKAMYPYNNGDFNLYVYGNERWNEQLESGASTRSRWLWYVVSQHNNTPLTGDNKDPYHVVIKSYQNQKIKISDSEEYEGHTYLRTYKPTDYANVVTSVSYENPTYSAAHNSIMSKERVNGDPTEYMLIGTSLDKVKLVTLNEVDGLRRTVNTFEQYWKNNPTVKSLVGGDDVPAADNTTLTEKGWHRFTSWAYSVSWNDATNTKKLESGPHWYQTISMNTGEFTFEEVSLKPQVILLDKHGWEIMRTPLDQPDKLKEYNSPMVERYHWYPKSSKTTGYHKYTVSDQEIIVYDAGAKATTYRYTHNSTSLADSPYDHFTEHGWAVQPDKVKTDFYVTYDVKSQYANSFAGASTEGTLPSVTYLIKQNSKWIKTEDGTTLSTADEKPTDNNKALWYLRPNFNIDREMGYLYKGESGAQEDAKSKAETDNDNYTAGLNGFDPYNIQIFNSQYQLRYLTANTTGSHLDGGAWNGNGTSSKVSLLNIDTRQTVTGYDLITLNITNATFMAVQDNSDNLRLMPRFDHQKVMTNFTALSTFDLNPEETQTTVLERFTQPTVVHSSDELLDMDGHYLLANDFTFDSDFTSLGTSDAPFRGTIDGQLNTLGNPGKPIVAYAEDAIIKNVILDDVSISSGNEKGNAGAICCEATGDTRIYNCGVKSGTISGTYAGSIVGKLNGNSRVINCYSFATVSGSTWSAGIVGYNTFQSTINDLRTMVMNCMFYGEISSETNISPIYGGKKITNVSNLNGYNYYRFDADYSRNGNITAYNCALAAEEKYLTRFEFFRNVLNSNRELAAWYATGDPNNGKGMGNACEMAKWVLDPADKPYPILKTQGYYPSFINYEDAPTLGEISLTINESNTTPGGQTKPTGASINSDYTNTLTVYDKDLAHNHFNYRTVRLPYYNEVGIGNCTKNKVVTGWKITGFTGEGTQGHFVNNTLDYSGTTHDEGVYPPYNFADRYCTDKDKYSVSGRVFSQGAYYDVPEGVTGITIEPYWGAAVYLSDPTYDVAYPKGYASAVFVSNMGDRYVNGNTASINGDDQTVYTTYSKAFEQIASSGTVYDNAIVLVGNYHHYWGPSSPSTTKAFTIMSADLNNDCEPDYGFIVQHGTNRQDISAIRFDFINSPGLGMIQKVETDKAIPKHGIWCPKGWFEVTNTTFIQFTQFEYDKGGKSAGSPLILLGGIYDQFITARQNVANSTEYIHLGSNIWMKEFCNGVHTNAQNSNTTRHIPISVTGGEFESFYLTGTFRPSVNSITDNAECYINGGKFGDMAGAGQEQLKGDVTWLIDHADITNFYGGGINGQKPVTGNIYVEINNSNVELYCGGPKFGNMSSDKKVTTKAKGSTFGNFYGAGYGGTSYFRDMTKDVTGGSEWDKYVGDYTRKYVAEKGISTEYEYEFIPYSGGQSGQANYVGRFYVLYASLSLAETKDVESTLEDCHITGSFYGGGKLGRVDGDITSTLKNCIVDENVFGAGFSASVEKVNVVPKGAKMNPNPDYNESVGVFTDGVYPDGEEYTWTHAASVSAGNEFDDTNHLIYTVEDLSTLGTVTGKVTLNINGTTTVGESVYGGGEESAVNNDTEVNVNGGIIGTEGEGGARWGNVYGGGKGKEDDVNAGMVKGNTNVTISGTAETTKILHNVYGGGAFGSVGTFTYNPSTGTTTLADNTGMANVTITGGTFGSDGKNNGMVFGSSRGSEGDPESNPLVDKMAWVGNTNVVIGTTSAEDNTNPWIKGSVYGGGENGHNFQNASVTIHSGTIGIAEGSPITDDGGTPDDPSDDITYSGARYPSRGNVYGSGCGTDTYKKTVSEVEKTYFDFNAGIVRGNTTVQIDGGHVVHNVYGGGAMGSVGTYTLADEAYHTAHPEVPVGKPISCAEGTGTCTVTVSGGQIGVAGAKMAGYGKGGPDHYGHVFGAGRGEMHDPDQYPNLETCAYFNKAILNISGSAFLTGSAYGGSESGHVLGDTEVTISGGQIGCGKNATEPYGAGVWVDGYVPSDDLECASWPYEAPYAPHDLYANATPPLDEYSNGKSTEGGRLEASDGHTYYGNVFGGGSGCVPYFDTTEGISKYLSTAGSVEGTATVTISGGHILTNVYGGCEATNVKGSATVTMTGGTVGVPRTFSQIVAHPVTCYVFGAGKGDQRISFNKETNVDRATVSIVGGKVYGSVFGGGEDGHVLQNTTVNIGTDEGEGPTIGTLGTSYVDGNVFGGGRGFSGDALTAGNVGGSVELNIKSGKILGSVYGGGRLASVGYGLYLVDEEIEEDGQKIKPYGILRPDDKYDGSYPNPSSDPASTYYNNGRGYITINISGGTIGNDNEYIYNPTAEQKAVIPNTTFDYQNHLQYTKGGNVFSGGMGRLYAQDGTTLLLLWPKLGKCKGTTLNMTGGTVKSSIYGGGEIGAVAEDATVNIKGGTVGTKVVDADDATKYYYFGSVFGGGKGSVDDITYPEGTPEEEQIPISEAGTTGGNVAVSLNETVASDAEGAVVHQVFGCNDMNGSPKGTVTVHVYSTQTPENANISTKPAKNSDKYDVEAVYGGGNLAAYIPTDDNSKASVTIDGCDLTSINTVYGGGNAASVPASEVIVAGTYEIGTIFGGGNGKDKLPSGEDNPGANVGYKADGTTTYGKGTTFVDLQGGLIHDAYGGSNAKGKIWKTASVSLNEAKDGESGAPCCPLVLDEVYGAGNEAYMEGGTSIDLVCISKLGTLYGGAKNADVNGGVMMNIQSGNFERVFGGNNIGGNINGAIEVNIEETGCYPIIIGELYGGGNLAGYSVYGYNDDGTIKESGETPLYSDPTLNIKSFTSIGSIYGGGYGETAVMVGNPKVNINEVVGEPGDYPNTGDYDATGFKGKDMTIGDHTVTLPAHAKDKIGAIGNVFGGGNAAKVIGNTTVNIGTLSTINFNTKASGEANPRTDVPVEGVDIRGNVYGGGNNAEVTGDANVNIGNKVTTP